MARTYVLLALVVSLGAFVVGNGVGARIDHSMQQITRALHDATGGLTR